MTNGTRVRPTGPGAQTHKLALFASGNARGKPEEATGSHGKQREATGRDGKRGEKGNRVIGKRRPTTPGGADQRITLKRKSGSNGKPREAKGNHGKPREATGSNGKVFSVD